MLSLYAQQIDGTYYQLDLPDGFTISITLNNFDLKDISRRGAVYSTTIKLPSTYNNDRFFLDAYDFKSALFYNHKSHIKAYINSDDGDFLMSGKIFIVSANKENGNYSYEISFISSIADVFTAIEGKTVRDVLEGDTFDYTVSTYINDYSNPKYVGIAPIDVGDGYFTFLPSSSSGAGIGLRSFCLRPVVRLTKIIEKIITSAGYSIDSSSFIYTSDWFKRIYILGDNYNWVNDYISSSRFIGKENTDITFVYSPPTTTNIITLINNYPLNLPDEVYDSNNIHHDTLYYISIQNGNYSVSEKLACRINVRLVFSSAPPSVGSIISNCLRCEVKYELQSVLNLHTFFVDGVVNSVTSYFGGWLVDIECNTILNSFDTFTSTTSTNSYFKINNFTIKPNIPGTVFAALYNNQLIIKHEDTFIDIARNFQVLFDGANSTNIPIKFLFSDTLKASELLKDILRAFNLIMYYDDYIQNKINIVDFNGYFQNIVDGSDIIDSNNIKNVLNHEYQSRNISLMWGDRNDYFCIQHKQSTANSEGYGDRIIKDISEYSTGEYTITTRLGTIAMVDEGDGYVRNAVYILENGQKKINNKHGLRILCYNGQNTNYKTIVNYQTGSGIVINSIAQYSHYHTNDASTWTSLNHGYVQPIVNINYSFPTINWYTHTGGYFTTNNDLYRLMFYKYLKVLNSQQSRILRVKMLIRKEDMIHKMNRLIYYDGGLFFINKISGFKHFGSVCDVELIRVFDVELYESVVEPYDNYDNNINTPTARIVGINNVFDTLNVVGDISANRIVLGGEDVSMRTKHFNYDQSMGNIELNIDGPIAQIAITNNILPNAGGTISININTTLIQTINSTSAYYIVRGIGNYTGASESNIISIIPAGTTQGNFELYVTYIKNK